MRKHSQGTIIAVVAVATGLALPAAADEVQIGFNAGWNKSLASDVRFTGPGGTDFTVNDVPWLGLSFPGDGGAPYYGVRAAYWFDDGASWGVMLDYTHAKVRAKPGALVTLAGATGPSAVAPGVYPVSALFDRLEFTDGIALATLNALYRFRPSGRFQPYVGVGAGINIPHVEVTGAALTGLPTTFAYETGGFAAQGFVGVDVRLVDFLSFYGEYRLSYADVNAPLSDPAFEIDTSLVNNQILFGVSVHFGR